MKKFFEQYGIDDEAKESLKSFKNWETINDKTPEQIELAVMSFISQTNFKKLALNEIAVSCLIDQVTKLGRNVKQLRSVIPQALAYTIVLAVIASVLIMIMIGGWIFG